MNGKHFKQLGNVEIAAVSDGQLTLDLSLLRNISVEEAERIQKMNGVMNATAVAINTYVVRTPDRLILIDSGAGGSAAGGGHLLENLATIGISPQQIDGVLLTHAHPDHIGGLRRDDGSPTFCNAELIVHTKEYAFWTDETEGRGINERIKANRKLASETFDAYGDRVRLFESGEVSPAIVAQALHGHTPGHTGYQINGSKSGVLIFGDILHFPYLQSSKPEIGLALDWDESQAVDTRRRLLDIIATDNLLIGGMHLGGTGFATFDAARESYRIHYCPT